MWLDVLRATMVRSRFVLRGLSLQLLIVVPLSVLF